MSDLLKIWKLLVVIALQFKIFEILTQGNELGEIKST